MKRAFGLAGLGLLAVGFFLVAPACGQDQKQKSSPNQADQKSGSTTGQNQKAATPEEFVRQASAAGLAEVNLGRLAEKQASSDEVKKFARRMVEDHNKANEELNKIADKKRLMPARAMDAAHERRANQLTQLTGAGFDQAFIKDMVADHEKAVSLFEAQANGGTDPDLKAFASKTLPTLKEHLKMARDLAKKEPGGANKNPSKTDKTDR